LRALRTDISKTGDSILTEIIDGIAHSQLVLADVSTIGKDSVAGASYRNANVMYEVGIALACRLPSEVLLIRDDEDKFLFDLSSVPHKKIDFTNIDKATAELRGALLERLQERSHVQDARIELALSALTNEEAHLLLQVADQPADVVFGRKDGNAVDFFTMTSIPRLLDKQLISLAGEYEPGHLAYRLTPLGRVAAQQVKSGLQRFNK
jgi:hypothetical protein